MALSKYKHSLARANRITSSRIGIIATGNYRAWNSMAEKIRTAKPAPIRSRRPSGVKPLDWGHQHEDRACSLFWLQHAEYDMFDEHWRYWHDPRNKVMYELCGTSPDRTLYQRLEMVSGVEAKCPWDQDIFRRYWSEGVLPEEYRPQVAWHMVVTDLPDWWFVSFDPRATESRQYFELRCERDYAYEAELMDRVTRFIEGYIAGEEFKPKQPTGRTYEELFS